jgi:hypothetical protein
VSHCTGSENATNSIWFTGAALGSFLALIATVSSLGFAWYRAAATEHPIANSTEAADREKARLKLIRDRLQTFYVSGGLILNRPLPKDIPAADFERYVTEVNAWVNETSTWIDITLGYAAAARFLDIGGGFSFGWNRAANEQHNTIINVLTKYRENLAQMIEVNAWDAGADQSKAESSCTKNSTLRALPC